MPKRKQRRISARERAEQALWESEDCYRNLFENANEMIATFTLEGTITGVNRGLEIALGWSRKELIGQPQLAGGTEIRAHVPLHAPVVHNHQKTGIEPPLSVPAQQETANKRGRTGDER